MANPSFRVEAPADALAGMRLSRDDDPGRDGTEDQRQVHPAGPECGCIPGKELDLESVTPACEGGHGAGDVLCRGEQVAGRDGDPLRPEDVDLLARVQRFGEGNPDVADPHLQAGKERVVVADRLLDEGRVGDRDLAGRGDRPAQGDSDGGAGEGGAGAREQAGSPVVGFGAARSNRVEVGSFADRSNKGEPELGRVVPSLFGWRARREQVRETGPRERGGRQDAVVGGTDPAGKREVDVAGEDGVDLALPDQVEEPGPVGLIDQRRSDRSPALSRRTGRGGGEGTGTCARRFVPTAAR